MKKALFTILVAAIFTSCANDQVEKVDLTKTTEQDLLSWSKTIEGKLNPENVPKLEMIAAKDLTNSGDIAELLNADVPLCTAIPATIAGLNSGSGYESYTFTSDASASAAAMGFSGSIGRKELSIIRDYVRYEIVDCGGVKKKYGIGLRCFIHVKSIKAKLTGSYASIAAATQLDQGSAKYSLKSLGFAMQGDMIATDLDGTGDYNVENFGKLAITFNNVLKTLKDNNSTLVISPVELPN